MKVCAKVCWCTQGIWTTWFQNQVLENQKQVTFHACQLPFVMSKFFFTSILSPCFLRPATVLRLAVLCLSPFSSCLYKCSNLQAHRKKKSNSLWQHLVQYHWTQDAQEFTTCYQQEWLNRSNGIYGNTKEVTPTWWSIYRSTYPYPSGIITIITPNLL